MTGLRIFLSRVFGLTRHRRADSDLQQEIAAHIDEAAEEFVRQGMDPAQARRTARQHFGSVAGLREAHREVRTFGWLEDAGRDVRHAGRRLLRARLFSLGTVLTLGLAIGANTAIYSVVNGVLLRPLPFPEADRLVGLWQTAPGVGIVDLKASIADYLTYREHSQTLADVALWNRVSATVTFDEEVEQVMGLSATWRFLPLLGVQPVLGRPFAESDITEAGSASVVMLGYGYWQRRFGGDPAIVGSHVRIDGVPREVVGVLPQDFWFMDAAHDVIFPIGFDRPNVRLLSYIFDAVGRLHPGVTLESVNADVARMIQLEPSLFEPPPGMTLAQVADAQLGPNVRLLSDDLVGGIGSNLWVVMAALALVLVIACANVANLMLVRAEGRAQERAVRAAIGAGRARLVREQLLESLMIGLAAGVAGIALAAGALKVLTATNLVTLPRAQSIAIDITSLGFALLLSVVVSLAVGIMPMLRHNRGPNVGLLRAASRNASAGRDRNLTRSALTAVQVALALLLLVGSGLMIRSFQSMSRVDPGVTDPAALQTFRLTFRTNSEEEAQRVLRAHEDLANRLAALPGVTGVGLMSGLPMTGMDAQDPIYVSDRVYEPGTIAPLRRIIDAGPGTFRTLGAPVVAGREFTWTDIHERRRVVMISEGFAREMWDEPSAAVGKRIRENTTDEWSEVIGVVADIRYDGVDRPAPSATYWPLGTFGSVAYLVRSTRTGTTGLAEDIRRVVSAAGLPVTQLDTMAEIQRRSMSRTTFTLALLAIGGFMALLLAVVGTYAVVSYAVSQRTREIGIRLALGARHARVQWQFVRRGMLWAALGVILGVVAALPLSRLLASLLFEVSPADPLTYLTTGLVLLGASVVASYLPSRRVTRVQPVEALKSE